MSKLWSNENWTTIMYCEIVNQFKILTIQECPKNVF